MQQPDDYGIWGSSSENFSVASEFWRFGGENYGGAKARETVLAKVAGASEWLSTVRTPREKAYPLTLDLLITLSYGTLRRERINAYRPRGFQPEEIALHLDVKEFETLLYQRQPRGTHAFIWDSWETKEMISDKIAFPFTGESFVSCFKRCFYASRKRRGAALVLVRKEHVDVYPIPPDWKEIVERVRRLRRKMTAKEKLQIELTFELGAFIGLLGWKEIDTALRALRPS